MTESLHSMFAKAEKLENVRALCPNCGAVAMFATVGNLPYKEIGERYGGWVNHCPLVDGTQIFALHTAKCLACSALVVGAQLANGKDRLAMFRVLWPKYTWKDSAPASLHPSIRKAYDEARNLLEISPRSAAVLARRCLQHVIREKLGIKERTLFLEIEKAVQRSELTKPTCGALDHIRQIGNWGAHPLDSSDPAEVIVEVTLQEAEYTLQVLELLFHDLYVVPERTAAMAAKISSRK